MELCKNCKHYDKYDTTCLIPTGETSLVTGRPLTSKGMAYLRRGPTGICGPEAKLYDPKLTQKIYEILQGLYTFG